MDKLSEHPSWTFAEDNELEERVKKLKVRVFDEVRTRGVVGYICLETPRHNIAPKALAAKLLKDEGLLEDAEDPYPDIRSDEPMRFYKLREVA